MATSSLEITDASALKNLGVFAYKALSVDKNAILRIRNAEVGIDKDEDNAAGAKNGKATADVWLKTAFNPLAQRRIALHCVPEDTIITAAAAMDLAQAKISAAAAGTTYPVSSQPSSAWPGYIPSKDGWHLVDVVPAKALRALEQQARAVAVQSSGPLGLPTSLLDHVAMTVKPSSAKTGANEHNDDKTGVDVTMREVFALCTMGFIPTNPDEREPVRVSAKGRWVRLDGRFGSVYGSKSLGVLPI